MEFLECRGVLDEDAFARSLPNPDNDSGGCCESESTRTSDHEYSDK